MLETIVQNSVPQAGLSRADAASLVRRGWMAGEALAKDHVKDSPEGRAGIRRMKDLFNK